MESASMKSTLGFSTATMPTTNPIPDRVTPHHMDNTTLDGNQEPENDSTLETATPVTWTQDDGFEPEIYDNRPLIVQDPQHAIPYVAAMGLTILLGIFGNLMIIGAHAKHKKLRKAGNILVINLALADLCVTAGAEPMCILGVVKGKQFFDQHPMLCEVIAAFCLTACFCSLFSLTFITFNTFLFVCFNRFYYRVFTKTKGIFLCVILWIAAIGFEAPNFVGWGGHNFNTKNHQCFWNARASHSYSVFMGVVLVLLPLVSMVLAYCLIFLKIFRTKKEILKFNVTQGGKKGEWLETFCTCRTMCCIVVGFVICWIPYALVAILDHSGSMPTWVHLWFTFVAHLHSIVNFFIYLGNKDYRNAFASMLCCHMIRSSEHQSSVVSLSKRAITNKESLPSENRY